MLYVSLPWLLTLRSFSLFLISSPPEVAPPAPLQTQDGSAVAKKKKKNRHKSCSFFCLVRFWGLSVGCGRCRKQTPPSLFFSFFHKKERTTTKNNFYLCKDDPAAPSKRADGFLFDTSQHHRDPGREGRGPSSARAIPPRRHRPRWRFLGTTAAIFLCVRYILDMWKTRKKWRENIFILLYRRNTWTKTLLVLCLHANTMSGVFFWSLVRIPSSQDDLLDLEGGAFFSSSSSFAFVRQKCVLVPFCKTHTTQSREHRTLFCDRAALQRGADSQLFIHSIRVSSFENSFRSHFSFLHPTPRQPRLHFLLSGFSMIVNCE